MKKNIYVIASIIGLAGYIFSYDTSNLAGSIKYIQEFYKIEPDKVGKLVLASLIGNFFGSFSAAYLTDFLGRKKSLLLGILISILGLFIVSFSYSLSIFYLGRIIFGISVGIIFVAAPIYIVEVSPASKRGRTGAVRQIFLALGLIFGYTITYLFELYFSLIWNINVGWRVLIFIEILFLIVMFLTFTKLPESPRWLIMKHKDLEAKKILSQFLDSPEKVDTVYSAMIDNRLKENTSKKVKIKGGLIFALLICIIFPIFRQLSGINAVTYYAQNIFAAISRGGSNMAYFQSVTTQL